MKNFNFFVNRICANTPPYCSKRASRFVWVLVLMLTLGVGQMWGATYNLYSGALTEGDYIIYYDGYAMKAGVTSDRFDNQIVTPSNNKITDPTNENLIVWHIAASGDYWTIYNTQNSGKYAASTGAKNKARLLASCTGDNADYCLWSASGTSTYEFVNKKNNANNVNKNLRNNGTNGWACYSTQTGGALTLYKKAASNTPTITKSSSMTTLTYSNGSPVAQSFTIGGSNLTNTVTVTAPTDYEVCKTVDGTYESSISFTNTEVNAANKTVYIRLQSGLSAGNISSRNISITSEGATAQTIAVTGSVPYKITWMANGSSHATTYVAVGSTLALPATDPVPNTCGCTGKAFYGWYGGGSSYKNASVAPTIAASGNTVNADKTYYAVFADAEEGDVEFVRYQKVTSAPTNWTTDKYVIATADNGKILTRQASTNNYGDYATMSTTTERASAEITISTTNTANIYKLQQGTKYLALNANGNSLYFVDSYTASDGTNNKCDWKIYGYNSAFIVESPLTYKINNTSGCYRAIQYNATSGQERFACYKHNTQTVAYLYKRVEQQSVTYSNYATSCCQPLGTINGSVSLSQNSNGKLQASWDEQTTTTGWADNGIQINIYEDGEDEPVVTSDPLANSTTSFAATDFTPKTCTQYYATLTAIHGGGDYCAGNLVSASSEKITTAGYSLALKDADGIPMDGKIPMGLYSITEDLTNACTGTTITLEQTNETGYRFDGWDVYKTGESSTKVTVTNNQFTMPAYDVTVSAVFAANTSPSLTVLDGQAEDVTAVAFGNQEINTTSGAQTFTLYGENLTEGVAWELSGSDAAYFAVTPASPIAKATAESTEGQEMSITFTPNAARNFSATLTFSSTGASNKVIALSGTGVELYTVTLNLGSGTGLSSTTGWSENAGVYTQKQASYGSAITLPSATPSTNCNTLGWTFAGWATDEATSGDKPELIAAGEYTPTSNQTLYAVYAKENGYKLISSTEELTANEYYVLTSIYENHEYALSSEEEITYTTDAAGVDITSKVSQVGTDYYVNNPEAAYVWKFTGTASAGQLAHEGVSTIYLQLSNYDDTPILHTTGEDLTFSYSAGKWSIKKGSAYLRRYYVEDSDPLEIGFDANSSAGEMKIYKREAEYKTSPNCAIYSLSSAVNMDKGTVELSDNATSLTEGATATATYTVTDDNYRFVNWTISGEGASIDDATANPVTITMGTEDATITANFEAIPTYTVTWSNNGDESVTSTVKENVKPTFPSTPTCEEGNTIFYGWATSAWGGSKATLSDIDNNITLYTSEDAMPVVTGPVTYYAVFGVPSNEILKRVTSVSELYDGCTIAIIDNAKSKVLVNNNSYADAPSTDTNGNIAISNISTWTLLKNNNTWRLYNGTLYLGAATLPTYSDTWKDVSLTENQNIDWTINANSTATNTFSFLNGATVGLQYYEKNTTKKWEVTYSSNVTSSGTYAERLYIPALLNYQTTFCQKHDVTVSIADGQQGNVSVSPAKACEGTPVTLTVTSNEGYELATLLVAGVDKKANVSENQYAFNMPNTDVEVSATFSKIAVTGVTINGGNNVEIGSTLTLTLEITPSTARPTIEWSASNSKATVNENGVVTGVAEGDVTITTTVDDIDYTKAIHVTRATKLGSIEVTGTPKTAYTLNEEFVAPTVTANYLYSDNDEAAYSETVDGATFTGYNKLNAGNQTVTVSYNEKEANYNVTVAPWTLHLQTKRMYGDDVETPTVVDVEITSLSTPTDLKAYYVSDLCTEYTQVGYIASSANVDALPNDLLTSYTPSADDETLYGVFTKTNYAGQGFVNEDFSSITTTVTNAEISVDNFDWLNSKSKAYPNTGEVKLGSSNAAGSLTTKALDLSHAFVVKLRAKQYNSTEKTIQVTVGTTTKSETALTDAMAEYTFNFNAATSSSQVVISTTSSEKRAYVDDIQIYTLDDVEYTSVYDCREEKSITYDVVSDQATWTSCEEATILEGKSYTVCTNEPMLQGYDFGGWIVNGNEENILDAGAQITVSEDLVLTAKWTAHVYDYHYDLSATATNGSITSVTVNGVPTELAAVELHDGDVVVVTATANENYELESWSHSENIVFSNIENVATFTVNEGAGDVTVAANFTEKPKYTISLYAFGRLYTTKQGYEGATYSSVIDGTESPAVVGYSFSGWSTTEADNTDALISGDEILTADVTLYAIIGISTPTGYVYHKVTSMSGITADGYYLIVNETAGKAFNGSRNSSSDLNSSNNYVTVAVSGTTITSNATIDAAIVTFGEIENTDPQQHYIKTSTGYYIGASNSNGLNANKSEVYGVTLDFDESGNFLVDGLKLNGSNEQMFMFNNSSANKFGFYGGTQQKIQLYKRGEVHEDVLPEVEPTMEITTNTNASNVFTDQFGGDVIVKNGATLTIDDETSLGNVIVENGGNIATTEAMTVNDLIIHTTLGKGTGTETQGNAPGACGQISNANNITAVGDVYLELELTQDAKASAGWYAFSVPFPVDAMNGVYYGDTKLTNEVGYAIMSHYGDLRAQNQYAWKKFRGIMQPGVFYVITVGDTDYKTLRFKKVADEALVASSSVSVSPFPSQTGNNSDGAWNGIGNPNLAISNLSTPVTAMQFYDHKTNTFIGRSHSVNLVVGSAFFIQYNGGETVSIPVGTTLNNGYLAPRREQKAVEEMIYEVQLTNVATGELEDNVFLTAREDATNEYEIGHDVAKMSMGTAKCAQMWVPAYGTQLCAADFQLVNDRAEYPLTFTSPVAGNYSISTVANENADIYLTLDGSIIWNLSMGAYELELPQGTTNGYGLLLQTKAPNTATGVDSVQPSEVSIQKVIIDEHVYILRGEQMYDVTGKMVR